MIFLEANLRSEWQSWFLVVLVAVLNLNLGQPKITMAQELEKLTPSFPQQKSNFTPPQRGAPGNRNDAGSRSHDLAFLPLIPKTNKGLTISSHPTFWLYMSPHFSCNTIGFTLLENGGKGDRFFFQTQLKNSQNKGLIKFTLPNDAPPLTIEESYRWIFSCGANARYGEIERIALSDSLAQKLDQISQEEKIEILKMRGIWYEVLTILIDLRMSFPKNQNVQKTLENLLQDPSVDLQVLIPLMP